MSDFEPDLGFEDCWSNLKGGRSDRSPAAGSFSTGKSDQGGQGDDGASHQSAGSSASGRAGQPKAQAALISAADKARLARVVRGAVIDLPTVM